MVLFNIGWMKFYEGQNRSDRIVNGGKYVDIHETGGEVNNFLPKGNYLYGYVRPPRGNKINIEKLGAEAGAQHVDNVTVVFTATPPKGKRVVVGWYRDARVWRHMQRSNRRSYFARAKKNNCTLLEVDERALHVPRAHRLKGTFGFGRSQIRYVHDNDKKDDIVRLLCRFLDNPSITLDPPESKGVKRKSDPARRYQVEKAAIDYVIKHYKGYRCKSVERENKGWDLEFKHGSVQLLVEVKGCSGHDVKVELTPNEYTAMRRQNPHYRLAIVTNALDNPHLSIVSFNGSDGTWRDKTGRKFRLKEMTGARVDCR